MEWPNFPHSLSLPSISSNSFLQISGSGAGEKTWQNNHPKRALCVTCCEMDLSWQPVTGAAQRRKQGRLRSWWRHEQQSIAAPLRTTAHSARRRPGPPGCGYELKHTEKFRKNPRPGVRHAVPRPRRRRQRARAQRGGPTGSARGAAAAGAGTAAHRRADHRDLRARPDSR